MIYGANLAAISLVLCAMWFYATRVTDLADPKLHRDVDQRILSMPLLTITLACAIVARFLLRHLDRRIDARNLNDASWRELQLAASASAGVLIGDACRPPNENPPFRR
jgi:hypothetical protein